MSNLHQLQKTLLESLGGSSNINESIADISKYILKGDIGSVRTEFADNSFESRADIERLFLAVTNVSMNHLIDAYRHSSISTYSSVSPYDTAVATYRYVLERIGLFNKSQRDMLLGILSDYTTQTTADFLRLVGPLMRPKFTPRELRGLVISHLLNLEETGLGNANYRPLMLSLEHLGYSISTEPTRVVRRYIEPIITLAGQTGNTDYLYELFDLGVSPTQILHIAADIHERQLEDVSDDPDAEDYTFWLIPAIFDIVGRDSSRTLDGWEKRLPHNLVGLIQYMMSEGYMG